MARFTATVVLPTPPLPLPTPTTCATPGKGCGPCGTAAPVCPIRKSPLHISALDCLCRHAGISPLNEVKDLSISSLHLLAVICATQRQAPRESLFFVVSPRPASRVSELHHHTAASGAPSQG